MRIFLSVATPERPKAEEVALALRGDGHVVFLDTDDLPIAATYHDRIRQAIEQTDLLVFFISPASVSPQRYTLSELKFAQQKWQHPRGCVIPVMVVPTPMSQIPPFLKAVSICIPKGDLAAEVAYEVGRIAAMQPATIPSKPGLMTQLFGVSSRGPAGKAVSAHASQPLLPMIPLVTLFTLIGFVSGAVTYLMRLGWPSDVPKMPYLTLTRGVVFATVLVFMLVFLDLARLRAILVSIVGVLAAFLVAEWTLTHASFTTDTANGVAGAIRAVIICGALAVAFPEFQQPRHWALVIGVSIASRLVLSGGFGMPVTVAWAIWDGAFAGALCFVLWRIGNEQSYGQPAATRGAGSALPRRTA